VDVDLPLFDHHPLDRRSDEALAVLERQGGERSTDAARKALKAHLELGPLERDDVLAPDRLQAGLHMAASLAQQSLSLFEGLKVDQPRLISVEQPVFLAVQLDQFVLERSGLRRDAVVGTEPRLGLQLGVGLHDQGRVLEMPPHLGPHQLVEFVSPQMALRTAPGRGSGAQGVVPRAIVVVMKCPVAPTHAMARHPQVTHSAADQSA
jgi:hypothetical protein